MNSILADIRTENFNQLAALAGQPLFYAGLLIAAGVLLAAAFFLRGPAPLTATIWLLFFAVDGTIFYVTFFVPPEVTDYDYGAAYETPAASVAWTSEARSSDDVCVPIATLDLTHAWQDVDSACTGGGSPKQNYFVYGGRGADICYNVTAEPLDGQQCRITGRFRALSRTRRTGLLQYFHTSFGMDRTVTITPAPTPAQ